MTVRNLDKMFAPQSIALIGGSNRPHSVGAVLAHNLLGGGFAGPILPVNTHDEAVAGVFAYKSIADLPMTPDLAVIATPPETVPGIIDELSQRGTRAAVVITAGFGEGGKAEGEKLRQAMLDAARPHLLRIVGPNCVGIIVPRVGLNASFAHVGAKAGKIAFVSQSGALATAVLDWCAPRGIGFSHVVSLGDMADVDFGDMLDYLALDPETNAILLYIESITQARKFMSAARVAARLKPVLAIKSGRFAEGAKAAASHTGAMAGSDVVFDAALRRAGILRVRDLDELFLTVEALARVKRPAGDRLAILTNGGGLGVIAVDELMENHGHLASLAPATVAALDKVLPKTWSGANPVDIIGDADGKRYQAALKQLDTDPNCDAILTLNCPTAVASSDEAAQAVAELAPTLTKPILTAWVGAPHMARSYLTEHGIPTFDTPTQAVGGFLRLIRYRDSQEELAETPPSLPDFSVDTAAARALAHTALREGREWLDEFEAKAMLAAYQVPVVETLSVTTPAEAAQAAAKLGGKLALKIRSRDLTHKSDIGGVILGLIGADAVSKAAEAMLERIKRAQPSAHLDGFTVQRMIERRDGYELIAGIASDPVFGPVVLFGQGGTAVEAIGDRAIALAPLNLGLANKLIANTRIARLLAGWRGRLPANREAIALTLVKLAQLAADVPEITELDINPLLASADGVIALDARVRVKPYVGKPEARLAIRPYPRELESEAQLKDGRRLFMRPIRPEDEPTIREYFKLQDPKDVYLRFFAPLRDIPHALAARLTQIDYDREMAIGGVLIDSGRPAGVARYVADPDGRRAEYAISIASGFKGTGIGHILLAKLIEVARSRGIEELVGDVLAQNQPMLSLARRLGFVCEASPDSMQVYLTRLDLRAPAGTPKA